MKAVIFDMDGVLINSMHDHILAAQKAFNEYGVHPSYEEIALMEGMAFSEIADTILAKYSVYISKDESDELIKRKKEILDELFRFEVYENVIDILDFLKGKGIRLALVTGTHRRFVEKIINHFPGFFDTIVTSSDVENSKPSPEPYIQAANKLSVDDIIVIENAPLGIESAKAAKLTTFALETTLNRKHLKDADRLFSNHKELLQYFRSLEYDKDN